jgi:hypothetical protein
MQGLQQSWTQYFNCSHPKIGYLFREIVIVIVMPDPDLTDVQRRVECPSVTFGPFGVSWFAPRSTK